MLMSSKSSKYSQPRKQENCTVEIRLEALGFHQGVDGGET